MPRTYIYVVATVGSDYMQGSRGCVPCFVDGVLYFGPCKRAMRPKMKVGDVISGISPSLGGKQRRVLFAARIAERITFAEAYERFPALRDPGGAIHVRPASRRGPGFPDSDYEHIPGGKHPGDWRNDLATPQSDAFFVCEPGQGLIGSWLGPIGPPITEQILQFVRGCEVHGKSGLLRVRNDEASEDCPIRHGNLYTGLHLESGKTEQYVRMISEQRAEGADEVTQRVSRPPRVRRARRC